MKSSTRSLTFALCGSIVATMAACGQEPALADEQPYVAPPPAQSEQQPVRQLEQLVAPIALYPDELVAEILTAATICAAPIPSSGCRACTSISTRSSGSI